MRKNRIKIIFPFICFIIISTSFILYQMSIAPKEQNYEKIIEDCVFLCIKASYEINLSLNPCLSDIYKEEWKYKEWVCYISHFEGKSINNKCMEDFKRNIKKFVELDPSCKPIRIFDGKKEIFIYG